MRGALLDLLIRSDTRGRRGLDDVMRALYQRRVFGTMPGSPAAIARIKKDDVITAVDGVPVAQAKLEGGAVHIADKAGQRMVFTVKRADGEQQVPLTLGTYREVMFRIVADSAATAEQVAVRRAWLTGVAAETPAEAADGRRQRLGLVEQQRRAPSVVT